MGSKESALKKDSEKGMQEVGSDRCCGLIRYFLLL